MNVGVGEAMKILIAGCARSGTHLTMHLMACFQDTHVHLAEADATQFARMEGAARTLVVKRTWDEHKRLPGLSPEIRLIYCVRHPYDVLTSSHPHSRHLRPYHVTRERWIAEYAALRQLRANQPQRSILYSRYEDMVADPDAMQQRLVAAFGLVPRIAFSEDEDNRVFASSVRKWEHNAAFRNYLASLPGSFIQELEPFCAEFGYDLPCLEAV